jgi:hypothetical protein
MELKYLFKNSGLSLNVQPEGSVIEFNKILTGMLNYVASMIKKKSNTIKVKKKKKKNINCYKLSVYILYIYYYIYINVFFSFMLFRIHLVLAVIFV